MITFLTKKEAQNHMGVSRSTFYRRAKRFSLKKDSPFTFSEWKKERLIPINWVNFLLLGINLDTLKVS